MQELLVNTSNDGTKILLVENGKLVEKYEEKPEKEKIEGNIYLGIVKNVLPGMQSAFVDIGQEKKAHRLMVAPIMMYQIAHRQISGVNTSINKV